MRKRLSSLLIAVLAVVSLTSCSTTSYNGENFGAIPSLKEYDDVSGGLSFSPSYNSQSSGGSPSNKGPETAPSYDDEGVEITSVQGGDTIQKDMLVYEGAVTVTTKDYEASIAALNEMYETYDCFIESSREYTQYSQYDSNGTMRYNATIRVNSGDYDSFMNGTEKLGVVDSKSSNVQNMNVEYSDAVTALRIQEARLERYISRLEEETDNEIALQIEREIANIQIEVQQLEARKRTIETDVAYSYVDLTLIEVRAYTSQVTHSDPLHVRLWAEVVNTYYEFTNFLVYALFFIIHALPYILILVVLWFVFRKKLKGKIRLPRRRCKRPESDKE